MTVYTSGVIQIPIQPSVVELVRLNVPLLAALPKWQTPDESLKWNVNVGGATVIGEAVTATVTNYSDDTVTGASLPIAQDRLRSSFSVLETKYTQAAARGTDELANLLDYSAETAKREILQALGRLITTGVGNSASGGILGLRQAVSASTGGGTPAPKGASTVAYAGIDPATSGYEKWTSLVYNATGALTAKKLAIFEADLLQGTTTGVPGSYNVLVMSPTTAIAYADIADTTNAQPASAVLDLGYGLKAYKGRPIVEDANVPDGEIHFVDTNVVRLYSFDQASAPGMSNEMPSDGLLLYVKQMPSDNPQLLKFGMFGMFQLQIRERRCHAILKNVSV